MMECIFCHSDELVKNGKRQRKVRTKQSYLCMQCNKQFVEVDGFERMRHAPKIIVRAIHMHQDGMSLSKIQNHLWQHDKVKVTRRTVSQWEKKYSNFLKSAAQGSKAKNQRKNTQRWEIHPCRKRTWLWLECNRLKNKVCFGAFLRRRTHFSKVRSIHEGN